MVIPNQTKTLIFNNITKVIKMNIQRITVLIAMLLLGSYAGLAQYSNGAQVISSGGGAGSSGNYSNFSVVGEAVVGKVTNGDYAGSSYGFIRAYGPALATMMGTDEICQGGDTEIAVDIIGGASPFTLVYTDGDTEFTINDYESLQSILVSPSSNITYTIVSVTDNFGNEAEAYAGSATITVNANPADVLLLENSGEIVEGFDGTITIIDSENGINYDVYSDGDLVGSGVGNGSDLNITISCSCFVANNQYTLTVEAVNSSTLCYIELSDTYLLDVVEPVTPTKWVISTNIGTQTSGTDFNITLQARDNDNKLGVVDVNTVIQAYVETGSGTITGNAIFLANTTSLTFAVNYINTNGEEDVQIRVDNVGGMNLTAGVSNSFDVRAVKPTMAASGISFANVTTNSMDFNWTNGNGGNRMIVIKEGSAVDYVPADGSSQSSLTSTSANFSTLSTLSGDNKLLYNGTGANSISISNLAVGATYHYAIYEYNGSGSLTSYQTVGAATGSQATSGAVKLAITSIPTTVTTGQAFSVTVQSQNAANQPDNVPVSTPIQVTINTGDGTVSGSGSINAGENSATFNVTYTNAAGESGVILTFDNNGGTELSSVNSNAITVNPAPPTAQHTNVSFTNIEQNSFTVSWTKNDNAAKTLLLARERFAINRDPVNGVEYTSANSVFGSATHLGTNQTLNVFPIYNGNATSVNVSGLLQETRYHFKAFAYTGSGTGTQYLVDNASGNPRNQVTSNKFGEIDDFRQFETVSISDIYPQPAKDHFAFEIEMPESSTMTIQLFSADGNLVSTPLAYANYEAGYHNVKVQLPEGIAAGSYSVIINLGYEVVMDRLIVMP